MARADFLKEKSRRFLETAKFLFTKEYYDLAAFNLEQACQLFLKYKIWEKLGDFEKTHSLFDLLEQVKDLYREKTKEIEALVQEHKEAVNDLEVVYVESRYLPAVFYKEQIEEMIKFVEALKEVLS